MGQLQKPDCRASLTMTKPRPIPVIPAKAGIHKFSQYDGSPGQARGRQGFRHYEALKKSRQSNNRIFRKAETKY